MVVELGDGQVAGLLERADVGGFHEVLVLQKLSLSLTPCEPESRLRRRRRPLDHAKGAPLQHPERPAHAPPGTKTGILHPVLRDYKAIS